MAQAWAVNDVMEVVIEGQNEGMPWAIVRHYLVVSIADSDLISTQLSTFIQTSILNDMDADLTDQWQAECLSISRVAPQPRNVDFFAFAAPIVGDITSDGVPNQTALLVRLTSAVTGPRGRGRIYICGLPESSTDGGLLTTDVKATWDANALTWSSNSDGAGGDLHPCIFSRTAYGPGPTHPADVNDYVAVIDGAFVVGNLAQQRRRRYKRNAFGPPA